MPARQVSTELLVEQAWILSHYAIRMRDWAYAVKTASNGKRGDLLLNYRVPFTPSGIS